MNDATAKSKISMRDTVANYVGGARVATSSGRGQPIFNPALGRATGEVTFSNAAAVALYAARSR